MSLRKILETFIRFLPSFFNRKYVHTVACTVVFVGPAFCVLRLTLVRAALLLILFPLSKTQTDTLLEVEHKTLSIKLGDVMTEALIDALADTVAVVKAKTLYETLNNVKAETLVEALNQTILKKGSRNTRRHSAQCRG